MPLYIRSDEAKALAEEYRNLSGAATITDAVCDALRRAIEAEQAKLSLRDLVAPAQARLAALGPIDPEFDMRAAADETEGA